MNDLMRDSLQESSSRASHLPSPMMSAGFDAVLHLPINERGRDIVIGDVHGQTPAFERLLDRLEVDLDRGDRLILLGDLVDRGEDSWGMIDWYAPQSPAFVLRGNHEQMLIDAADPQWMDLWLHNRGDWHETPPENKRPSRFIGEAPDDSSRFSIDRIRQHCLALPFAIAIEQKGADPVVCVHAEIPNGWSWPDFANALKEGDSDSGRKARLAAIWGRSRINSVLGNEMEVEGAALCIHGHIPIREVQRQANCLWIDTGAAYPSNYPAARITAVQVQDGKFKDPISERIIG